MPRYDKTGPMGKGPRTGQMLGKCNVDEMIDKKKDPVGNIVKNILGDDNEYEDDD